MPERKVTLSTGDQSLSRWTVCHKTGSRAVCWLSASAPCQSSYQLAGIKSWWSVLSVFSLGLLTMPLTASFVLHLHWLNFMNYLTSWWAELAIIGSFRSLMLYLCISDSVPDILDFLFSLLLSSAQKASLVVVVLSRHVAYEGRTSLLPINLDRDPSNCHRWSYWFTLPSNRLLAFHSTVCFHQKFKMLRTARNVQVG